MININITEKKHTDVVFIDNVSQISEECAELSGKKVAVLAPESQSKNAAALINALKNGGAAAYLYKLPDGEECKNIESALKLSAFLDENMFGRSDMILNFGGGTVCDLGGFVASIYKRGILYYNIPTTLLCAVDACIGGKTAVDCNGKKNHWGTFYQPEKVCIIGDIIKSLPDELIDAGKSEIVKYAVIDEDFYEYLSELPIENFTTELTTIIQKCLRIKGRFVELDERDRGARHALNAGHTIAHAIEAQSGFSIDHATAVMLGLITETNIAYKSGFIGQNRFERVTKLYRKYFGDYAELSLDEIENLIPFMQSDKKNRNGKICFVLPCEHSVKSVMIDDIKSILI